MPIGVIGQKSANQRQSYEPLSKRSSSAVDLKNSNGDGNLSKNWRTASTSDFRNESFSDGSDNLSTTSSKGNSRLLRDFSTEQIPTRLTNQQGPKLAYNPMQFVKTGPATKLSEMAKNQLEKAKEIKQLREIKRDDGEEWQANLEGWKRNRLKRQENVIERVKDVKRMEEEEALRAAEEAANRTKMLRSLRENRGSQSRLLSLYSREKDPEEEISNSSSSDNEQPDENPLMSRNSLKNSGLKNTAKLSTEHLVTKPNADSSESFPEIQVRVQPVPKPVAAPRRSLNVSSETNTIVDADVKSTGKTQTTQRYFEPLVQGKDFGTKLPLINGISASSTSVNVEIQEKEKVGNLEKGNDEKDANMSEESDSLENTESNESLAAEKINFQLLEATATGRDTESKESLTEASTNQVPCEETRTNEHLAPEVPASQLLASETLSNELLAPDVPANQLLAPETLSNELLAPDVPVNQLLAPETLSSKLLHPKASANELSLSEEPVSGNALCISSSNQNGHSEMIDAKTELFDWVVGVSSPLAPPSEKPPPPPPITDNEGIPSPIKEIKLPATIKQEVVYRDTDTVKSIRSELRKRRSDFLGFEVDSGHQDSTDQVVVPPPPDLKSLVLQTEVRPSELKMFADQPSDYSADKNPQRKSLDLLDLDYRKKEIIQNMEEEQTQHLENIRDSSEPKRSSLDKPRKFFSELVYEEPRFEPRFEPKTQPVVPGQKDNSLENNQNQEMKQASQNRALPSVPGQTSSERTGPKEQARVVANQNSSPQMPELVDNQYQTDPSQIGTSEAWKKTSLHETNLPPSNLSQNGKRQISLLNAEQINSRQTSPSSQDVPRHFNSQQSVPSPNISHHQETRQLSPDQNRAVPSVPSHNQTAVHHHEPKQISADQRIYFISSQNSAHNGTAVHHKDLGQVSTDQKSYPVLSQNFIHQKDVGQISTDQNRALPSVPVQKSTHNQSAFHPHEPRQVSSDQNRALPSVPSQNSAYNQTAVHHKDVGQANLTNPECLSPQQVQLRSKTPYFVKPRPLSVMDLKDKSSRFDPNALLAKRKPEAEIQKRDVQRHWLVQEAELRRLTNQGHASSRSSAPPHWRSMPSVAAAVQSGAKKEERLTSDWTTQKIATPHTTSVVQSGTKKEERPPSDWTTQKMAPPKEIHHPRPAPQSLRGNFPKGASLPSNGMLSISGRKKCSVCSIELGHGAAMIIESLQLYFHVKCFRCCVCRTSLGNGTKGTDVRIRNCQLHCQSCYSTGALRVSQV